MINRIDFVARYPHYIDHIVPVWVSIPTMYRGRFFVPEHLMEYTASLMMGETHDLHPLSGQTSTVLQGYHTNACLVAGWIDLAEVLRNNPDRKVFFMEHGVGLTPSNDNPCYASGKGERSRVFMHLCPNEYIAAKVPTRNAIIGTPKLDKWVTMFNGNVPEIPETPTVGFTFHWRGEAVSPEAGTAFDEFKESILAFHKHPSMNVLCTAHPRLWDEARRWYASNHIPHTENFEELMLNADILCADATSVMYEWLVTNKPAVILNSKNFRKDVNFGIRFWDFTEHGYHANGLSSLISAVYSGIRYPEDFEEVRRHTVEKLFPYLGSAANRAVQVILENLR